MRFSGWLGIAEQTEVSPGVWEETLAFVPVLGTVLQRSEKLDNSSDILPRYATTTSFSVPARGVGPQDNSSVSVLVYLNVPYHIQTIVEKYPDIEIFIGEEYHGPTSL